MHSDEMLWKGWAQPKEKVTRFLWRSGFFKDSGLLFRILHHKELAAVSSSPSHSPDDSTVLGRGLRSEMASRLSDFDLCLSVEFLTLFRDHFERRLGADDFAARAPAAAALRDVEQRPGVCSAT